VALDKDALVDTTEARTYLGVDADGKPVDAALEQIIGGLSRRVLQYTGRTYINHTAADATSTRVFATNVDTGRVSIDDCRSISVVEITGTPDAPGSWEPAETDLWIAEPLNEPVTDTIRFYNPELLPAQGMGWGALSAHLAGRSGWGQASPWPGQVRAEITARVFVRVTAKWGYGPDLKTVPANVKLAVLMWLQNIHKRDLAFFGENAEATANIAMPKDVKDLLEGEAQEAPMVVAV